MDASSGELRAVLLNEYGISASYVSPLSGGLAALAFRVDSFHGVYFLKVYEKRKNITASLLGKSDLSMGVSSWLSSNTELRGKINAPLLTKQGNIRVDTEDYAYFLFSFIDGITPQTTPLTTSQQVEIAEIVGVLHQYGDNLPFDFSDVRETYEIPCSELMKLPSNSSDSLCIYRHYDMLMRALDLAHSMAESVRSMDLPLVLCHTDIHGWNLLQSDRLILIDWESIKLAPAEADLYTFWGDWYWGDSNWGSYWDIFLPVYQRYRPNYATNENVLKFYQIRRHIEDIEEFYREYLFDDLTAIEACAVEEHLERECNFLRRLVVS